jgi:hypothetical protein
MAILRKIFWILAEYHIQLRAEWIPSLQNSALDAGSRFRLDLLHSYTGLRPDQLTLTGPIPASSLILPSPPLSPQPSHHLQTLLPLKKSWDWSPSRVYSPLWPTVPSPLSEALGTPFFGFSWPMAGLPSRLARNYLSNTRLGSSSPATPTPPSALTSPPSPLYILGLESRSRWQRQISRPWHVASKEFAATCKHLS